MNQQGWTIHNTQTQSALWLAGLWWRFLQVVVVGRSIMTQSSGRYDWLEYGDVIVGDVVRSSRLFKLRDYMKLVSALCNYELRRWHINIQICVLTFFDCFFLFLDFSGEETDIWLGVIWTTFDGSCISVWLKSISIGSPNTVDGDKLLITGSSSITGPSIFPNAICKWKAKNNYPPKYTL